MTDSLPLRLAALLLALLFAPAAAFAQPANAAAVERQFRAWLEDDIRPAAAKLGVKPAVFDAALGKVRIEWKLPDLVVPGSKAEGPRKQSQAEFRSPAAYFAEKNLQPVAAGGRTRLERLKPVLAQIERAHGVPGRILVSIWGRESGFGGAKLPHDAFSVLATKAFMATRKEMFREELLAALVMAQQGHAAPAAMKSSWAGALGQPQFMPTSFLKHAADGDGDGRADIWNSEADTLASIGNYLRNSGWEKGRDWGFEVKVPASVSCSLEGPDRGKKLRDWAAMGIERISSKPFPAAEMGQETFLLMPAGRHGPAFIVTPNFYALKAYNESDNYALFVGHAADRIQFAAKPFAGPWGDVGKMLRSDVAAMQRALEKQGWDVGGADGLPGFRTRRSIGEWQAKNGRKPTCYPSPELAAALR